MVWFDCANYFRHNIRSDFEINFHNNFVLVYLHNVNYDKDLICQRLNTPSNSQSWFKIGNILRIVNKISDSGERTKVNNTIYKYIRTKIFDLTFENLAYPLLFLPFLSRSSELIGKKISLTIDKNQFLMNLNVNILINDYPSQIIPLAKKLEVKILDNEDSFTEIEWKNLYTLSEETFVEETESLKQSGAGAGLTDND